MNDFVCLLPHRFKENMAVMAVFIYLRSLMMMWMIQFKLKRKIRKIMCMTCPRLYLMPLNNPVVCKVLFLFFFSRQVGLVSPLIHYGFPVHWVGTEAYLLP